MRIQMCILCKLPKQALPTVYPSCICPSLKRQSFDANKFELSFNQLEIEIPTKKKQQCWNNTFHFFFYRISIDLARLFTAKPFYKKSPDKSGSYRRARKRGRSNWDFFKGLQLAYAIAKKAVVTGEDSLGHLLQSVKIIASQLLS